MIVEKRNETTNAPQFLYVKNISRMKGSIFGAPSFYW